LTLIYIVLLIYNSTFQILIIEAIQKWEKLKKEQISIDGQKYITVNKAFYKLTNS